MRPALLLLCEPMPAEPKVPRFPAPPLPKSGHLRTWWRAPASPPALAWFIARAAEYQDAATIPRLLFFLAEKVPELGFAAP